MFSSFETNSSAGNFRLYRNLASTNSMTARGNSDLYIRANSGSANKFTVTIELSSRYSDSSSDERANTCDIFLTNGNTC